MDKYIEQLLLSAPVRKTITREIIKWADFSENSRGIDVGCGTGLQIPLLVEAVGQSGRVVGLDTASAHLQTAEKLIDKEGLISQVNLLNGNMYDIPFDDRSFDWVWSMDGAGYIPGDYKAVVDELVRVLKPGGKLVIAYWKSEMLLHNYSTLSSKLDRTSSGRAPFTETYPFEKHQQRMLALMDKAGLKDVYLKTFRESFRAPLAGDVRRALGALIEMRWTDGIQKELSGKDYDLYHRLTDPNSGIYVLNHPDYSGWFEYLVYCGQVK